MKSIYYDPNMQEKKSARRWFENVKLVGEVDEGTSVYIEDYAYTYLNQFSNNDLSYELCAVLIGECYKESNQVIVYGVILVEPKLLKKDENWIDENMLGEIEDQRKCYFPKGEYVGWMHTQPGYGIMPTTKEMAVHKEIFGTTCIFMIIDPVYKTEAFFTCKENKFEEKKGFCIYYERNELMQKYIEDHSFLEGKKQTEKDKVVGDFRKLGARRKNEVERKRRRNRVVGVTVAGTLLTVAFIMGIYSQQKRINTLQKNVVNIHQQYSEIENKIPNNPVELVFTSSDKEFQEPSELAADPEVEAEVEPALESEVEAEVDPEPVIDIQLEPEYDIHAVKIGDSLFSISYNYYKTVSMAKEIATLNNIKNHDTIYIGQELKLPKR